MSKKRYLSNAEIAAFCQQLSLVLNAGMPTYYGISILCEEAPDENTRKLLKSIYDPMEAGSTLYAAIKDMEYFPPYMINMIQLGEETGRLEEVLHSLSVYYDKEDNLRRGIKSAVIYPFILTILMIAVIVVMIAKVLPIFSQIYEELGSELTGTALTLMSISKVINKYLVILVIAFVVIFVLTIIIYHTGLGKILFSNSAIAKSISSSRFANCMYLALSSGLDTDKGLDLANELTTSPMMKEKIANCRNHIAHGETFANSLMLANIFSKMYSGWIAIGYKTGSMDEVMLHICDSYEDETDERLNRFITFLEPSLVIILCLFIGLILVSFLLPLLGIMSSIG